ncbi:hypothetical protein QR79_16235 [Methylobacterium indicum]|uniref:Uncharacterized protein n=1 Tax=Methylobacterium indicum TaxID=1775910 RepID=A0ABR5HAE1_9HYPH|nr:hypothetical protein QR79_16235 [Methylobacterium indicum]
MLSVLGSAQQLAGFDRKRGCQLVENIDRRVFRRPFDPADITAVEAGIDRQSLLGQPKRHPQPPHIPPHESPPVHEG